MTVSDSLYHHQFKKYQDIVYREAGIHLTEDKRALLGARISKRVRKLGIDSKSYLSLIQRDSAEMEQFINAISTNHTYFFRESNNFNFLNPSYRSIWCAASSSGEEPFSLAIHCLSKGFGPHILATDISTACLEKAMRAVYPIDRRNEIPPPLLRPYFERGQGRWKDYMRVKAHARRLVEFRRFNLVVDPVPAKTFDAIFCRNVMIYFDTATKETVVRKLSSVLRKGGILVIGGSESLSGLRHNLKYLQPSIYRKVLP